MGKSKKKKNNVTVKRTVNKRDVRGREKHNKVDPVVTRSRSLSRVSPQRSPMRPAKQSKKAQTQTKTQNLITKQTKVRRVLIKENSGSSKGAKNNNATLVHKGKHQPIQGDGIMVHIEGNDSNSDEYNDSDGHSLTDSDHVDDMDVSEVNPVDDSSKDSEISFGGTATTEQLAKDPHIRKLLNSLLEEKLKERDSLGKSTPVKATKNNTIGQQMVKSPSDTTIYTPAFAYKISNVMNRQNNRNMQDEVNRFVENVRYQGDFDIAGSDQRTVVNADEQPQEETDEQRGLTTTIQVTPELRDARARADKVVVDAERFKAGILPPPGQSNLYKEFAGHNLSDDDFFHLTCHIDKALREKIERGEYVELERLLPKDKGSEFGGNSSNDQRMEWVFHEGQTFLAPAVNKNNKINSVRKWDQAFRSYATIYCGVNPARAKELWQYISVIHTAASTYIWENVASYDYTFRHLMEFNPQRSWAITYTQMWNLSMKDPITKFGWDRKQGSSHDNQSPGFKNNHQNGNGNGTGKKRKYCWGFNKGITCKYGNNCRYIEKCSYCDSTSHGVIVCPKLFDKGKSGGNASHNKPATK